MTPPRRPRTAREEAAERLQAELDSAFRHTHDYSPDVVGMGRTQIRPGAPIQVLREHNRQMNSGVRGWSRHFQVVRDQEGNVGQIARGELAPRNSVAQEIGSPEEVAASARHYTETSPDAMRWNPQVGEREMGLWEGIFHDRRGE